MVQAAGTTVFEENFNWTTNPATGSLAAHGYVIYGWNGSSSGTFWNDWTFRSTTAGTESVVGYYALPKQGSGSAFLSNLSGATNHEGVTALQVYKNGETTTGLGTASISHEVSGMDTNYYHTVETWFAARANQTATLGVSIGDKTFTPISYTGAASNEAGTTFTSVFVPKTSAASLTLSNIRETAPYADSALLLDNVKVTNTGIPVIDSTFTPVYSFNLLTPSTTNLHTNLAYDYDFSSSLVGSDYDRVMYRVELTGKDGTVSALTLTMDDFSNGNVQTLGIPVSSTAAKYAGTAINNLSVDYTTTGTPAVSAQSQASTSGKLQFFSSNYDQNGAVPATGTGSGYGSMRVFDADGNSLFAYSGWGFTSYVNNVGIGVNGAASGNVWSDWTFAGNVGNYTSANLYVYVHEYEKILDPQGTQIFQRDRAANTGTATVSGTFLTNAAAGTVAAVQLSEDGVHWVNATLSDTAYSTDMNLATGWHTLTVRALDAGGNELYTAEQKVGIGDIYITSGQSNAGSFSEKITTSTSGNVFALDVTTGEWKIAQDPQPNNSGFGTWANDSTAKGSVWPTFGDALTEMTNGEIPIGLVATAYGGASVSQWDPDTAGSLYHVLKEAMEAVGNDFTGILWHQGETDNLNNMSEEEYETHLLSLIDQSREDAGNDVLWFIAQASLFTDGTDENITNAQLGVTEERDGVYLGPNSDLLGFDYRISASNIHFNEEGQRLLGLMWAQSVYNTVYMPEPSSFLMMGLGLVFVAASTFLGARASRPQSRHKTLKI